MNLDWRYHKSILFAATIVMEGCWLYALISLLNKQVAAGRLSVLGILLLYLASFGFNKLLQRLRGHKIGLLIISWLAWAVGMLLMVKFQLFSDLKFSDSAWLLAVPRSIAELIHTFKPELLILLSTAALWWLGRRLAYLRVSFATLVSELQFGLALLAIAFFVASELEVDLAGSLPLALTFFLFALLGISIAHAQEGTSWLSGLHRGHWSGLLLGSIGLILLVGLLIGSLVTPDLLQLILNALKWVWGLIEKAIAFIASLFPQPGPSTSELPPMTALAPEPSEGFKPWELPEPLRNILRTGWGVLVIGLLVFALWRISSQIVAWLRRRLASMAGAELEPLPGSFRADLLNFLKSILFGLFRIKMPLRFRRKPKSFLPEVATVRQIYRHFLNWAAAGGYPRRLSQTPHEYLFALADLLPESREELAFITQHYVSVRYGNSLPTENELSQLRQSWQKIERNRLKRLGSE